MTRTKPPRRPSWMTLRVWSTLPADGTRRARVGIRFRLGRDGNYAQPWRELAQREGWVETTARGSRRVLTDHTPVTADEVAAVAGISRAEALRRLHCWADAGLVRFQPGRGWVATIDDEEAAHAAAA